MKNDFFGAVKDTSNIFHHTKIKCVGGHFIKKSSQKRE